MEEDKNVQGEAPAAQNTTVNNAAPKADKSVGTTIIVAVIALLIGGLGTFGIMSATKSDDPKCTEAKGEETTTPTEGPNGAQNPEDQKYAEARYSREVLNQYIEYKQALLGWMELPQILFPGTTRSEFADLDETTSYATFDVEYDAFVTRVSDLFSSELVNTNATLAENNYEYYNCDGKLCVKFAKGIGGLEPLYKNVSRNFEKVGDNKYSQIITVQEYNSGDGFGSVTVKFTGTFDESGKLTSVVCENL